MNNLIKSFKSKNIEVGYLGFYIHFIVEVACFYSLGKVFGDSFILWFIPLMYDTFAFVPQGIMGYIYEKNPKININVIGLVLLIIGLLLFNYNVGLYASIFVIAIGNACCHVGCAEDTLRTSEGKMASPAIFVAGGSFGVVTGKLLAKYHASIWLVIFMLLTAIPFAILSLVKRVEHKESKVLLKDFNYHNEKLEPWKVLLGALFIVSIRGFVGYGIPTSWNKTVIQTIMLFSFMGLGKALGGVFIDAFGIRKTAIWSMIIAVPFLIFGDTNMYVSLIGVMFFSMTMAVTLAICSSVLKRSPGLAFGITTTGLFLGTLPIFFVKIEGVLYNSILIVMATIVCVMIANDIIKEEK